LHRLCRAITCSDNKQKEGTPNGVPSLFV